MAEEEEEGFLIFTGGLNESDNTVVKPEECIAGYNFELGNLNTHFNPRRPFDLKGGKNLLAYSEQFDNAYWSKGNTTVSANVVVGPSGDLVADKIIATTANATHYIEVITPFVAVASGQTYTLSVYAKPAGYDFIFLNFFASGGGTTNVSRGFNVSTGVDTGNTFSSQPSSSGIESAGSGWYRVWITNVIDHSLARIASYIGNTASTVTFAGTGTDGIYGVGAQFEKLATRGAYRKTTTALLNDPTNGIMQLVKTDNTKTTLVQFGANVFEWDGADAYTHRGTVDSLSKLRAETWSLGNYLVIADLEKRTVVKKWDGTSFTTLTTGLGTTNLFAKYPVVHLGRSWFFNVKAGTDTPHLGVASAFENPESYDLAARAKDQTFSTGNEAFYILMPDLKPINGVELFANVLVVSTEGGRLWKLTGHDARTFAFEPFYFGSSAVGTESMGLVGNDMMYMRQGGVIESLVTTTAYGDVQTDDLSRWIRTSTKDLTGGIVVYDQVRQKVYWFVTNKVFVMFKDMINSGFSPWSVYTSQHSSSFNATTAAYIQDPVSSKYHVFWGDSSGNIYRMDGTGTGDGGTTSLQVSRTSKLIDMEETDSISGRIEYRRIAAVPMTLEFTWGDAYSVTESLVNLEGPPAGDNASYYNASAYYGGAFYYNTGFFYSQRVTSKGFSPVGKGINVYLRMYADTTQDFDVLKVKFET